MRLCNREDDTLLLRYFLMIDPLLIISSQVPFCENFEDVMRSFKFAIFILTYSSVKYRLS